MTTIDTQGSILRGIPNPPPTNPSATQQVQTPTESKPVNELSTSTKIEEKRVYVNTQGQKTGSVINDRA